jgi:hypothetical protein
MDGWVIGLIVLLAVGTAVIAYGGIADRRRHRRAVAQLLSPPPRTIPHLPAGAPAPRYLSAQQAHRPPANARPEPTATERGRLESELDRASTRTVPVGFASDGFVTDTATGRAVLDDARVLVSAEPIMNIRELVPAIEHMIIDGTPLVITAPAIAPDVLDTLEVNHIQRKLDLVVVVTRDPVATDMITEATGASLVSRVDLQTGSLADRDLGRCRHWVSERKRTRIVPYGLGESTPAGPGTDAVASDPKDQA